MKNEKGFTSVELIAAVCGLLWVTVVIYVIYLIISALQKYVSG
jgi:hypothetical protein